jgi:hypothetical protein
MQTKARWAIAAASENDNLLRDLPLLSARLSMSRAHLSADSVALELLPKACREPEYLLLAAAAIASHHPSLLDANR